MKMESSIFTSITNTRPKLTRFMFKMFKAFVLTKPMAAPQELVLPRVGTISQSSSETPFRFSGFTVGLSHLEKLSFAQASAYISFCKCQKHPKGQKSYQNFRSPTNYTPIDPDFFADHHSQKDSTLKCNYKKDISHNVSLYTKTLFGAKMKIFKN